MTGPGARHTNSNPSKPDSRPRHRRALRARPGGPRALADAGGSVTVGSRNPDRAAAAVAGIKRVEVGQLDLLDRASIDAFVTRYLDSGRPLHILINNAGFPATAEITRDARGYEAQLAGQPPLVTSS